jgi:hypothetical protein
MAAASYLGSDPFLQFHDLEAALPLLFLGGRAGNIHGLIRWLIVARFHEEPPFRSASDPPNSVIAVLAAGRPDAGELNEDGSISVESAAYCLRLPNRVNWSAWELAAGAYFEFFS